MPNHTFNTVRMEGIAKADFYGFDKYGRKFFDFNKLIPEPKTREECPPEFIDHGNCNLMHTEDDEWFNWYDWHCRFWGTKWNAYDFTEIDDDTVYFLTAWTEPEPIWKAISEKFPDKELYIEAEYEDGFETESTWLNGSRIEFSEREVDFYED